MYTFFLRQSAIKLVRQKFWPSTNDRRTKSMFLCKEKVLDLKIKCDGLLQRVEGRNTLMRQKNRLAVHWRFLITYSRVLNISEALLFLFVIFPSYTFFTNKQKNHFFISYFSPNACQKSSCLCFFFAYTCIQDSRVTYQ